MIADETLLTMTDAGKRFPRRISPSTIWRYVSRGYQARNGERIRLDHVRIGRKIFTSLEALDRFGRAIAEADASAFDQERNQKSNDDDDRAAAALDAAGA